MYSKLPKYPKKLQNIVYYTIKCNKVEINFKQIFETSLFKVMLFNYRIRFYSILLFTEHIF